MQQEATTIPSVSVEHYENFPVASWLCPPGIRQAVIAIYHFARTADDIADEGDVPADKRLADLYRYRELLLRTLEGHRGSDNGPWTQIFDRLGLAHRRHALPVTPLLDLLEAFEQDVHNPVYAHRQALLDYCRRSANPIGRLLLHLQGLTDPYLLELSDKICTALQLINFWQDLSIDLRRGRVYIPKADADARALPWPPTPQWEGLPSRELVRDLCAWARDTMQAGADLPLKVGGRMGLELRLVVQGGLRVLERIGQMDHQTFSQRPVLTAGDAPILVWRALLMRAQGRQAP